MSYKKGGLGRLKEGSEAKTACSVGTANVERKTERGQGYDGFKSDLLRRGRWHILKGRGDF